MKEVESETSRVRRRSGITIQQLSSVLVLNEWFSLTDCSYHPHVVVFETHGSLRFDLGLRSWTTGPNGMQFLEKTILV